MSAKTPKGEMPFLEHLEELRWRILWSLVALVVGSVIGFYLLQRFDVFTLLKDPIAPYLPEGKLFITRPTDAFLITLKLAIVIGAILASPVIFAQLWRFLAPALYEHERRYIVPALIAGLGLFLAGVLMAYKWVLPAVFRILYGFRIGDIEWIITADAYFGFATRTILAFGIMFQLPIVMVLLSSIGLIRPQTFARHRPIALVFASIFAALLTPPDPVSMLMMMVPLMVLYEVGIIVSRTLVKRRSRHTIGTVVIATILTLGIPNGADAQERPERPPKPVGAAVQQQDTARVRRDSVLQPVDTAAARRLGLPTAPSQAFPAPDSIMRELLTREGFAVTRYVGDSITLFGESREVVLVGRAMVEREGSTLEAGQVSFQESDCRLLAGGEPRPVLFDNETVLVGDDMRYDTCLRRGTVPRALTSFMQSGVNWYLRGGLEVDSASTRIYGASNQITSCDHPSPHYHISAHNVKWVNNTIIVARPAVLYVRDVPVLWLPFIFQDVRPGRRSGILIPRFGFNDLVRPSEGYRRHVSNIGYYFAINNYVDFQGSLDWFDGNYIGLNGQFRYRWLDRFLSGGVSASWILEDGQEGVPGARSMRLQWNHQQTFDQRTRLTAAVDYATSARVVQQNSIDPFLQTATLSSRINFNKQFNWGTFSVGGNHSQDLSNGTVSQTLPTVSLTPSPISLWSDATWSPAFSLSNSRTLNQTPGTVIPLAPVGGQEVFDTLLTDTRTTTFSFRTPLRVGRWNWANDISVRDFRTTRPPAPLVFPDPNDPADSVTRYYGEDFRSEVDWNTGINLPILFASSWKLQPSVGIRNTTGGAFLLRNRFTGGDFVAQGKRLSLSVSLSPTVFGFFPGVGPLSRIRHSLSPRLSWTYSPKATVPEAYARALDPTGQSSSRESPAVQRISLSLSQTFEGKLKPAEGDTVADPRQARKTKLLSIQTSPIEFDVEQAKEEGRNGWTTQRLTNRLTSDLLPGFSLGMTHDLWDGPVGFDTTAFDPFLTTVSARFTVSANTFNRLLGLVTGGAGEPSVESDPEAIDIGLDDPVQPAGTGLGPTSRLDRDFGEPMRRGRGVQASVTYDDQRTRPRVTAQGEEIEAVANRTLGFAISFAPTPGWSVSWNTQYNMTLKQFGQHVLRLDRTMHRWRATFAFLKAPNGNFSFNFYISLLDEPELKFQYDQRTLR
ncbi:MAG: twin-arginine translocase subunit TatC [Gemmatimonadota bacterium]|nr:twin-arginine translocase subunit TatC [Gemmatimonadota bacterium]